METVKLKPCPFCGSEAECTKLKDSFGSAESKRQTYTIFVGCKKCHAYITAGYAKYAIKAWNRRETSDHSYDPLCNGTYKMVPSGDIVDIMERDRRLGYCHTHPA